MLERVMKVFAYRLTFCFALVATLALPSSATLLAQKMPSGDVTSAVSGRIYVSMKDGSAQLVRGVEVFLTCATPEYQSIADATLSGMLSSGESIIAQASKMLSGATSMRAASQAAGAIGMLRDTCPDFRRLMPSNWRPAHTTSREQTSTDSLNLRESRRVLTH